MSIVVRAHISMIPASFHETVLLLLFASCIVVFSGCGGTGEENASAQPSVDSGNLISLLQSDDPDQRLEAAKELHRFPGSTTVTALINSLRDEDPRVRETAAVSLGRLRDALAVDALINLLSDKEEDVAVAAANALGLIGHPAASEPLYSSLNNGSPSLAEEAITALGRIGTPEAATDLLKAARKSTDERISLIQDSLESVGKAALKPLMTALAGDDDIVAKLAADTLLAMGQEGIASLLKSLTSDSLVLRQRAVVALGRSGDLLAVKPLISALGDQELHQSALTAIIEIGEKSDDDLIKALLADNPLVRKGAAEALGSLGISRAVPFLFELRNDPDREVRMAAQEAINQIDEME